MLLLRLGVQVGLLENRFEVKRCIEGGAAAGESAEASGETCAVAVGFGLLEDGDTKPTR